MQHKDLVHGVGAVWHDQAWSGEKEWRTEKWQEDQQQVPLLSSVEGAVQTVMWPTQQQVFLLDSI